MASAQTWEEHDVQARVCKGALRDVYYRMTAREIAEGHFPTGLYREQAFAADLRQRTGSSLLRLKGEGQVLYRKDASKKGSGQRCD